MEKFVNGYCISTDKAKLDLKIIHDFLSHSYWSKNIPLETVMRSIDHSLSIGVYRDDKQVGFARVITDFATFAYIADVFIIQEERGKGLSRSLMQFIMEHPGLQGLRRSLLATRDAHGLYEKFGFKPLEVSSRWMEKHTPDVYSKNI